MKKFCLLALLPLCVALNMAGSTPSPLAATGASLGSQAGAAIGQEIANVEAELQSPSFQDSAIKGVAALVGIAAGFKAGDAVTGSFLSCVTTKLPEGESNYHSPLLALLAATAYFTQDQYAPTVDALAGQDSVGQNALGNFTSITNSAASLGAVFALVKQVFPKSFEVLPAAPRVEPASK